MNALLKTVRFDLGIGLADPSAKFGALLLLLGIAATLLFSPVIAPMFIPFGLTLTSASLNIILQKETRRLYGVLPVRRSTVIRAAFLEYITLTFAAELLMAAVFCISRACKLYELVRALIFNESESASAVKVDPLFSFLVLFALTAFFICFMRMMCEIFGKDSMGKILFILFIAGIGAVTAVIKLINAGKLASAEKWMPQAFGARVLTAVIVHAAVIGICLLFCGITEKKTADYEL